MDLLNHTCADALAHSVVMMKPVFYVPAVLKERPDIVLIIYVAASI
jgi:hypothetical protein